MSAFRLPASRAAVWGTSGATLIELAVVIALIGIIAAVAAVAIQQPMKAYADTSRRAEMSEAADTALRRIGREVRLALPNSIRTGGGTTLLEFLPIRTGGRYRSVDSGIAGADPLTFDDKDTSFNMLGAPSAIAGQVIQAGSDIVVVRNENATTARSNAYTFNQTGKDGFGTAYDCGTPTGVNCNSVQITAGPADAGGALAGTEFKLTLGTGRLFNATSTSGPGLSSPGNRFYVIAPSPVSFVCAPGGVNASGDGTGTLTRVTGYAIQFAQSATPALLGGATSSVLANNVTACSISYDQNALGRNGLIALELELTRGGERIRLYYEVHVNNAP